MAAEAFDVLILGGGTAGCVLADRLSEDGSRRVGLVEAGPDYGPREEGMWPGDMLDARTLPSSHVWGFEEPGAERARIVGGCSAHNACFVVWGSAADYDEWGLETAGAWDFESIEPYLRRAQERLRTRLHTDAEISSWDRTFLGACGELGFSSLETINDPNGGERAGTFPVNAVGTVRWNTSFAYLDVARTRRNLTMLPGVLIDRLEIHGDRVNGVRVIRDGRHDKLTAGTILLAAGTYGSAAILLRSGIGPEQHLLEQEIPVMRPLPGVGRGMTDHYGSYLEYFGTDDLVARTKAQLDRGLLFQCTSLLKAKSSTAAEGLWNLHVLAWTDVVLEAEDVSSGGFRYYLAVKLLKPRSRGWVRLRSADPRVLPAIDQEFLSEPEDVATLVDGLRLARTLARTDAMTQIAGDEIGPGATATSDGELADYARESVSGYFHPVGTCRMGLPDDPAAVVDASGRVHGFDNLFVVDASIMPTIPRANTNLTVVAVAERLADEVILAG